MPVCLLKSSPLTQTSQYEGSHNVYYVKSRAMLVLGRDACCTSRSLSVELAVSTP